MFSVARPSRAVSTYPVPPTTAREVVRHDEQVTGAAPTAHRPLLGNAPAEVRKAVEELLGSAIAREHAAPAGFTASIASTVTGARGSRLFIKAAPIGDGTGEAVAAGITLARAAGDLGAPLVGSVSVGAWRIAAYEVLRGEAVQQWTPEDIPHLLHLMERLREHTVPCPPLPTTPYADAFTPLLGTWAALLSTSRGERAPEARATGETATEQTAPRGESAVAPAVKHLAHRRLPVDVPLDQLADLESRWLETLSPGEALHHGDLRRDNVVREPSGRLRIVDWTHLWTAPGWLDLVRLLPDVAASGHDPQTLLGASCWAQAPPADVNVALAGWAGRAWREGHLPEVPGLAGLRAMQREQGLHTLRWLQERLR